MNTIQVIYLYEQSTYEEVVTALESGLTDTDAIDIFTEDRPRIRTDSARYSFVEGDSLVPDEYVAFRMSFDAKPLTRARHTSKTR